MDANPNFILSPGTTRFKNRDERLQNIAMGRVVEDFVRTSYGPRGLYKMIVNPGEVTVTNDGFMILKKIDPQHPIAMILVDVAWIQRLEAGDGTTTAIIIVGELLKAAENLMRERVRPPIILKAYKNAMDKTLEILGELAITVKRDEDDLLRKVASTSMAGKCISADEAQLAEIALEAAKHLASGEGSSMPLDWVKHLSMKKKVGGGERETMLVHGVLLDKEVVHPDMPRKVEEARIALIQNPLDLKPPKTQHGKFMSHELQIFQPHQMKAFKEGETKMLRDMVAKIKEAGANVVLSQRVIEKPAQHMLAREGILAVRHINEWDMTRLQRATGGKIVPNLEELTPEDLGYARLVEERRVGDDKMVFVEGCKEPRSMSILIRGVSKEVVDEGKRSFVNAVGALRDVLEDGKVVGGGGAVEMEVARRLKKYALTFEGRDQLAVVAYAKALEMIPIILSENAGLNWIEVVTKLRALHEEGGVWAGIDVMDGKTKDTVEAGIIDPLRVKTKAIKVATETVLSILRVDDMMIAKPSAFLESYRKEPEKFAPVPTEKVEMRGIWDEIYDT